MTETIGHDIKELHRHLTGIRYAMFTTRAADRLRSRPMTTIETDAQGEVLVFLANDGSELLDDIGRDPVVDLAYSDNDGHATYRPAGRQRVGSIRRWSRTCGIRS